MNHPNDPLLIPAGDCAVEIRFGNVIDREINRRVYQFDQVVQNAGIEGILQTIPTYGSLLVYYDPLLLSWQTVQSQLRQLLGSNLNWQITQTRMMEIPVIYGGAMGPDLSDIARLHSISEEEVIRVHSRDVYQVYMMGFTPGFAYLGELDPMIVAPRLEQPRTIVPAGSVGIAGNQTGIYPIQSPGGWRIIGRTKAVLYDPHEENPFLLQPGDRVRFVRVRENA